MRDLESLGYKTWLDSSLRGGQKWWDEILQRNADSDVDQTWYIQGTLSRTGN